jgi:hypothetical protein
MTKTAVKFSFITPLFSDTWKTLKTKVGDGCRCIFEVECSVGGFLILKQMCKIVFLSKVFTRPDFLSDTFFNFTKTFYFDNFTS